ncbi:hypothetical protein ACQ4WX_46140 [Streptomyces lasalocidi]
MADPTVSYPDETGHFVRWSVQHRHARDLAYGTVRWTGPLSTIDSEKRWADARRLLNDDTLPTPDRVAGLLLILYAQKIATISQLTVDDVHFDGDTVAITFGTSPVVLRAPLSHPGPRARRDRPRQGRDRHPGRRSVAVPGRTPWAPSHRQSDRHPSPRDRDPPQAVPLQRAVHPRHRSPGCDPRPDARRPHQGRRPMAEGIRRDWAAYAAEVSKRRRD